MLEKEHNLNTNPIFAVVKQENYVGKKLTINQLQSRFESCHPDKQKSFFFRMAFFVGIWEDENRFEPRSLKNDENTSKQSKFIRAFPKLIAPTLMTKKNY